MTPFNKKRKSSENVSVDNAKLPATKKSKYCSLLEPLRAGRTDPSVEKESLSEEDFERNPSNVTNANDTRQKDASFNTSIDLDSLCEVNQNDSDQEKSGVKNMSKNEEASAPLKMISKLIALPVANKMSANKLSQNEGSFCEVKTEAEVGKTFKDLGVCEELCLACESLGWKQPTDIQIQSIPHALNSRDIIGLAETGSGKTASFAIPIIQKLLDVPNQKGIFALVLAPTRELTVQIAEQFQALGAGVCLKVCTIVGGLDMFSQALELAKKPHIVVGTPGRVVDHLENTKGFSLGTVRFLVLDEADRLLSMDFEEALNSLLTVLPKERNTYLFSATMTSRVCKLQRASLVRPVRVEVSNKFETSKNLVQAMRLVQHREKWTYLVGLVSYYNTYSIIIFVNTCLNATRLALCLRSLGFEAVGLHGKMSQPQRLGALNSFKAGRKRVLVVTEVGSRGLDIPHVDIVINFDVPLGPKDYIHRVGRTARAGRTGRAITLVTQYDIEAFQRIEQSMGKRLEVFEDLYDEAWKQKSEEVSQARKLAENEIKDKSDINQTKKKRFNKKRR